MSFPINFSIAPKRAAAPFFGNGLVAHIAFADPVCPDLAQLIYKGGAQVGAAIHKGGTLLCIEGPAFSTRAESNVYRQWGMDIIGMTSLQEAKLAREAEICYAAMAMVTDFDCWHAEESEVNVETVVQNLEKNISLAKKIIRTVVPENISRAEMYMCPGLEKRDYDRGRRHTAQNAKKLELLVGKYLKD